MAQAKLSLSWDAHQKNICSGLTQLQQRGEFVDMTLAADGHHVKVHQMVMALVSPYIKDLISSAPCPHPVIFLNNISYTTLSAILEYIYTGEVLVPKDHLGDLISAGRALHIKGLKDMNENDASLSMDATHKETNLGETKSRRNSCLVDKLKEYKEKKKRRNDKTDVKQPVLPMCKIFVDETDQDTDVIMDDSKDSSENWNIDQPDKPVNDDTKSILSSANVQFTVSNQGGLQIIYNRYIYHLRYIQKNRTRLWRCIDYSSSLKCRARLFSNENNGVIKRSSDHNHSFHDAKILKKIRLGTIYSAIQDAENQAQAKKNEHNRTTGSPPPIDIDSQ